MSSPSRALLALLSVLILRGAPAAAQLAAAPAAAAPADVAGAAPPDPNTTLAGLVAELEAYNPRLQAARSDVDMRVARIAPAGALPDPTFSIGYMGGLTRPFFPSATTPNAYRQFGVSQDLPYPGKRALRTNIATTDADAERWTYEDTRRQLVAELKAAYFDYVFVDRSLAIVQKNKALLEEFRTIAETRFGVGKGTQQDVLKAQLEISLLLERLQTLERDRGTLQARINALLYRPPDTPLPATLSFAAVDPLPDAARLQALVERNDPALRRDERLVDRGQQALALAKKDVLPDFAINVTSQKYTGGMPWMYGVDFMVKVPLYWQRKQRPMIAEATAALERSRRMRENTLATVKAQVAEEYLAATTSKQLVDLFSDSVLPQAHLALESSLASYQVGTVDFLTMLTNFVTVLNYEVNYQEQAARYNQALARLEPLVGTELVR
jgi:cobalt-zinc-cadmium efflux system outer membrane protein